MSKVDYPVRIISPSSDTKSGRSNLLVIKSDDGSDSTLEDNLSEIAKSLKPLGNFVVLCVVSEISALVLANAKVSPDISKTTSLVACRVVTVGSDCRFLKGGEYCFPVTSAEGHASGFHMGSMIPVSDNPISLASRIADVDNYLKTGVVVGTSPKNASSIRFSQYYYVAEHLIAYVFPSMVVSV